MPYENTHLYLADKVKRKLGGRALNAALDAHLAYFQLGSIFPDTLFYSKEEEINRVAYKLHGDDGQPTSRFVFDVLDVARDSNSQRDFAFIAGYLTHCAADITFHPLVFYMSGYKPNAGKTRKQKASYLHWKYETLIDSRLNDVFRFEKCIQPRLIHNLIAPEVLGVEAETLEAALKKQKRYFSKIGSRFYYHAFRVMGALGCVPPESVAGFYHSLNTGDISLPERIHYRDVLSGENLETSLESLVQRCVNLGVRLVTAAHEYVTGGIDRAACEVMIAGESLHTGKLGKTMQDIRYAAPIDTH
jgi:hypothetical protein